MKWYPQVPQSRGDGNLSVTIEAQPRACNRGLPASIADRGSDPVKLRVSLNHADLLN